MLPALHKLQKSRGYDPDSVAWVYTVAMSTLMGTLAGVVQSIMGSPGDLPETIAAIHEKARLRYSFTARDHRRMRGWTRNHLLALQPQYLALSLIPYAMTTKATSTTWKSAVWTKLRTSAAQDGRPAYI